MNLLRLITARTSGSAYDPDAQAFFTAASITDATQKSAVNTLVTDLKAKGLWNKMYAIYPMVGGTTTTCSYNLKNPSAFQMTFAGTWDVTGGGILPTQVTNPSIYADTNFNCSTHFASPTDTSIGVYCTNPSNNLNTTQGLMGVTNALAVSGIAIWVGDRGFDAFTNNSTAGGEYIIWSNDYELFEPPYNGGKHYVTGDGFYINSRSNNTSHTAFVRGVDVKNITRTTSLGVMPNKTIYLGALNPDGHTADWSTSTDKRISFAFIGTGLSASDADNYFECVQKFNTTLLRHVSIPAYETFDTDALPYINHSSASLSFRDKCAANYLVQELKNANLWTKLKAIYPYLGTTLASMRLNLKNPAQYMLTIVGSGASVNYKGLQFDQSNTPGEETYARTDLYETDFNHIAQFRKNDFPSNYSIGVANSSAGSWFGPSSIIRGVFEPRLTNTHATGLQLVQREGTTNTLKYYRKGVLQSPVTNTFNSTTGLEIVIGTLADAVSSSTPTFFTYRNSAIFRYESFGDALTDAEATAYNTIVETAQRYLGRSTF